MPESKNAPTAVGSTLKALDKSGNDDYTALAAGATKTYNVNTQNTATLVVDIVADQDCSVVITPILDIDEDSASPAAALTGSPSDTGSVTRRHPRRAFPTAPSAPPRALVQVTNDGASDTTTYTCSIRGQV